MGRTMRSGIWPWPRKEDRARMHAMLDRLGIGDLAKRHIRMLSGGQQQRVFLARALLSDPTLLLLDEPTSNVDVRTRDEILHLLADINREGITVVLTTHELNAVATHLPWGCVPESHTNSAGKTAAHFHLGSPEPHLQRRNGRYQAG